MLNANEYFFAEHPKKHDPVDALGEGPKNGWLKRASEEVQQRSSYVDAKTILDKLFHQVHHEIRGDGIGADND